MDIDFELLKRKRTMDPFALAPVDIEATVAFTAEVMRDNALANPEVLGIPGVGVSRVVAVSPTPRLRQRLAVLGWVPRDPATDDIWFVDEPIAFPVEANRTVVDFAARYYAESMNLLFAPDDGMFDGGAFDIEAGPGWSAADIRSHVKFMAERQFVAKAIVVGRVPVSWLVHGLQRDIDRANAARTRAGLPLLSCPAATTVGRWLREFRASHFSRPGLGSQWRCYEGQNSSAGLRAAS